jgi:hypothetical protein
MHIAHAFVGSEKGSNHSVPYVTQLFPGFLQDFRFSNNNGDKNSVDLPLKRTGSTSSWSFFRYSSNFKQWWKSMYSLQWKPKTLLGYVKKTRPVGAKTAPCDIQLRKKIFSHRSRKLPNPSPLHRGLRNPRESWVSATHRAVARPGLSLCFENEERRGSFFNPGRNSFPTGDELGT